jgi:hypothetical protein
MKNLASVLAFGIQFAAGMGCQAPPRPSAEGMPEPRKVVGWRLVERTYGHADPNRGVAGDGEIPSPSKLLLYEPVFAEARTWEFGALSVRTICAHEIRLKIVGELTRTVGEQVTAECRIDGPESLYHELSIEPTSGGMDILEVRGAARGGGRPGRYLVPGNRVFEVVFTSQVAGRGTVAISVLREVGRDPTSRSTAIVGAER